MKIVYNIQMENMSKENTGDSMPFVNLEKSKDISGQSAMFYDVPGHPELVIRKCLVLKSVMGNIDKELAESDEYKDYLPEELEKVKNKKKVEELVKNAGDFQKMGERYGLKIAKTSYAIGTDPNLEKPGIFAVTDRIVGENLATEPSFSEKMEGEIDKVYAGIFAHFRDSYMEKSAFWKDFKNSQIMLGKKEGDIESSPYIIDVDPLMISWSDPKHCKTEEDREAVFWSRVGLVFTEMKDTERKTLSGDFSRAKEVLNDIIRTIPEPNGDLGNYWYHDLVDQF